MQPKLTNRIDFPSSSSASSTMVSGQGVIEGGNNSDFIFDEQNNKGKERIFVICDACYWATTYLDKSRLPVHDSRCTSCQEVGLSSFPILANESFVYTYSEKRGVELSFKNHKG